ncbi:hypothetical protein [Desulfosarcina ovata]|uniref:Uncharacterized protein n=1 Tax=Desulfosarcina ovata subsp. ovata TaxID=2752305 RepID=A0A5K8AJ29_9BACT|nr:hypothetical protein [Desulfosarcina ovata]BBO92509.1 hypothetical protein DSCOOX_56890 [Desulfosarcina ovata subsp. ovata]
MLTKKNHRQQLKPVINERRAGIDRRVLTYDWYIPERRTTTDRRQGQCEDDSHGEWRDRRRYA